MRLRRRDSGISMILVVVLIFITLIGVVAATVLWSEWQDQEARLDALKKAETALQNEEAAIKQAITKCNEATGIPAKEDGTLDAAKAADVLKKWRQEYWSPDHYNKFPFTPPEKGAKNIAQAQVDEFVRSREQSDYLNTLESLIGIAAARTSHVQNRAGQLLVDQKNATESAAAIAKIVPELPKRKEEIKGQLLKEIQRLGEEITKENEQYNARKTLHTEARAKAEMEIAEAVEKYAAEEIKVNNEIRELRRQLEELKLKEVISHQISFVHGKILRPDVPNRTAFIDIGARERVVPGLKFLVGKKGLQGSFDFKAKVEVKKAWMTYAEVAIIEIYNPKERPVVDGDHIVNPLFSKERPLTIAFVGEDRPTKLRYSVDEAARRIKEIGSEVRREITLDLDYVVFTEGTSTKPRESYDNFRKAVFLEIPIAEASDIFKFLGD
jgi:hypothetical protein